MLKECDFVRIKDGTVLDNQEKTHNWAGEIYVVDKEAKTYIVFLDAISIQSITDDYLRFCLDNFEEPSEFYAKFADVELMSERRDTEEENKKAMAELIDRTDEMEGADVELENTESMADKLAAQFQESSYFEQLNERQQGNARFAITTFVNYLADYEGVVPSIWKESHLESVCEYIIPRKISAEPDLFEDYGEIIIVFIDFLDSENQVSNAHKLKRCMEKMKDRIPKWEANSDNWGPAKAMMMGAMEAGVDMDNLDAINKYMHESNINLSKNLLNNSFPEYSPPLAPSPFRNIGRNEKVSVVYPDGTTKESVKFKKVQKDLESGACELMEE
ncbi:MAG: hypothetical protein ACI85I_001998 [Arenicella sp.]|jgi:hypothetical protein